MLSLPLYPAPPRAPRPQGGAVTRVSPRSVRISLTDRCDLACIYCRPSRSDGYLDHRLDVASWMTMVEGLVAAGVRRVRITGGEPLLFKEVVDVVRGLTRFPLEDIALTTNATRLAPLARPLREAGLRRLTVSLDTLDADRFARITRGGDLAGVLAGIEAARAASFDELKLNVVVVRGENDDELEALTRFAWERGMTPRFLEIMAVGEGANVQDRVVTGAEIRARLAHLLEDQKAERDADRGPAKYVQAKGDARLRVGFITGTSDTYCAGCDRLRVGSDGTLRPCLATEDGVGAEDAARSGNPDEIAARVARAWEAKPDGETFRGCTEPSAAHVSIRAIGG